MPNTPILGLAIPQGLSTPGGSNATVGSYPYMWAGNLNIIDSGVFSPGNPVPLATPGLLVNANLNMLGFGITNASTLALSSTLTVAGISTLTGGVASPLLIGAGLLNTITIAGAATGANPTIAVAGDANRGLQVLLAGTGSFQVGNPTNILSTGAVAGFTGLWPVATSAQTNSNYAFINVSGEGRFNGATSLGLAVANVDYVNLTSASLAMAAIPIIQGTAATALTLKGNAAATGGTAITLDNQTTQTSGTILNIATGGTQKASVDFSGAFFSNAGKFGTATASTALTLTGNSGTINCFIAANTDVGGTGTICTFQSNSASQFSISGRGHLIPLSTPPAAPASANFNAGYTATLAVTAISINGSDSSFQLKFTVNGAPTPIAQNSVLVTITLSQAYQSLAVSGMACYGAVAPGASGIIPLAVVQNAVGTIQIIACTGFTPVAGAYVFNVMTMGAGATS
jgi:hypothetical protein